MARREPRLVLNTTLNNEVMSQKSSHSKRTTSRIPCWPRDFLASSLDSPRKTKFPDPDQGREQA